MSVIPSAATTGFAADVAYSLNPSATSSPISIEPPCTWRGSKIRVMVAGSMIHCYDMAAPQTFIAYVEFDPDTNLYVGTIPGLPGGHSQAHTLDELQQNLREVVELIVEERIARGEPIEVDSFVGIQQIVVDVEPTAHR